MPGREGKGVVVVYNVLLVAFVANSLEGPATQEREKD